MKYRIYDTARQKYVTDDPCWILKPDGRLAYNDYGDEIGYPHCIAEFSSDVFDLNGVEVYEGDIIQLTDSVRKTFGIVAETGVVRYHKGNFFIGDITMLNSIFTLADINFVLRGKVVGNIHEGEKA